MQPRTRAHEHYSPQNVIPVFGQEVQGQRYVLRRGGYAVICREPDEVGIVQTPDGFFLIGGGVERDESPEAALLREAREESGLTLKVTRLIGSADELVFAGREQTYFRRSGTFFGAEIVAQDPGLIIEPDHAFIWLPREEALRRLVHGSHRWAVERLMRDGL